MAIAAYPAHDADCPRAPCSARAMPRLDLYCVVHRRRLFAGLGIVDPRPAMRQPVNIRATLPTPLHNRHSGARPLRNRVDRLADRLLDFFLIHVDVGDTLGQGNRGQHAAQIVSDVDRKKRRSFGHCPITTPIHTPSGSPSPHPNRGANYPRAGFRREGPKPGEGGAGVSAWSAPHARKHISDLVQVPIH